MLRSIAPRFLVAASFVLALGVGCGSTGGGCGGMKPLPADPKPFGFPTDQLVEGGVQARITKPGVDKLTKTITDLASASFGGANGICVIPEGSFWCHNKTSGCSPNKGCTANLQLTSSDGMDGIRTTVLSGQPVNIVLDVAFDFDFGVDFGASVFSCTLDVKSPHYGTPSPGGTTPNKLKAVITLGIDPATGQLTLTLSDLSIGNLAFDISGCSVIGSILNVIGQGIQWLFDSFNGLIGNALLDLIRPQLNQLVQNFLPKPLGLAGTVNTGALLSSFNPPKDTNLEMFLVPGGYVSSSSGGLTLGVMAGMNSDRDQTTRAPGLTSEPSLCVPNRPTPELASAPWNLPFNTARKDYTLNPAGEFAGNPDPTDPTGMQRDVAIGLSRTFLDLAGFHVYNSGTLCLAVGGDTLPQLTAGTLSLIVQSLSNVIENTKSPLALVLRPTNPLTFTIGTGDMTSPLLNIAIKDLRIDFYGWVDERWARLFTVGVDLNVGLNLTVSKNMTTMAPELQPVLVGLDAKNIQVRVSNTDLLAETPADLAAVFPSLINIATGALGSSLPKIALPSISGFSLDDLVLGRVQTSQDDFVGVYATIKAGTPAGLIDWSDPTHPRAVGEMRTRAEVAAVDVPSPEKLAHLFDHGAPAVSERPRVTLRLSTLEAPPAGKQVEYGWRVDGGMWRPWTRDTQPVIADDAFLLQGRHTIEVRSRVVDEYITEDSTPSKVSVLIDTVPPELHPALDKQDPSKLDFGGLDLVSDSAALEYRYQQGDGTWTAWSHTGFIDVNDALRITGQGRAALIAEVRDEAGLVQQSPVDVGGLTGFHGRTTDPTASGGCGCDVGGAQAGGQHGGGTAGLLTLVGLALSLVFLRRRRAQAAAHVGRALTALVLVGSLGALALAGAGCGTGTACNVDDDCTKMACPAGKLATCQTKMCVCQNDISPGQSGHYASMALIEGEAFIAAYNNTYGDLVLGHVKPPGVVPSWDFIDGVPDEAPSRVGSQIRGGIEDPGDDVGRYASIDVTADKQPVIAYYDSTHKSLRFAYFRVIRWGSYAIDGGTASVEGAGDDIGRWASLSVGKDGRPAIAYTATVMSGMSGKPEGQLRYAQAMVPNPTSQSDWKVTIVDARALPDGALDPAKQGVLPEGIALMPSLARKPDGSPGIAYYDRTRGNLRYVEGTTNGTWGTPVLLDGETMTGADTGDVGLYPSLAYDTAGVAHIAYEDATHDNLLYVNSMTRMPEVADDGYRPKDEQTLDGLDEPVFHLVGDSSSIQTVGGVVAIAYQDSTVMQLRLALRGTDGKWQLSAIAGHGMPNFQGAYGFWANLRLNGTRGVMSSYAINQQVNPALYYVEVFDADLGIIQ